MTMLNLSEVLQFAVRIEENGREFYRRHAELLENGEVKKIFLLLADEEVKHEKVFREMLSKVENYEPAESYPGEYFAYLRSYADEQIFARKKFAKEVPELKSPVEAVKFALQKEAASVFYYLELKKMVPEGQRPSMDAIVEEERTHFVKLSKLQRQLPPEG